MYNSFEISCQISKTENQIKHYPDQIDLMASRFVSYSLQLATATLACLAKLNKGLFIYLMIQGGHPGSD